MLTIADRRIITSRASEDAAFRDLLFSTPRDAVKAATGKLLPSDAGIEVLEEGDIAWMFVMLDPARIDADLPTPRDIRGAVENQAYALLRDDPTLVPSAEQDPVGFLRERLGVNVSAVDVRHERAGETLLVLPCIAACEALPDEALDMVTGGGDSGCKSGALNHTYNNYSS